MMRPLILLLSFVTAAQVTAQSGVEPLRDADDKARDKWNEVSSGPRHAAPADTTRIYSINDLEQLPEFPGGMTAMNAFIADSFQYTDTARSSTPGGRIYIA